MENKKIRHIKIFLRRLYTLGQRVEIYLTSTMTSQMNVVSFSYIHQSTNSVHAGHCTRVTKEAYCISDMKTTLKFYFQLYFISFFQITNKRDKTLSNIFQSILD